MRVKEAADKLDVSVSLVYLLIAGGKLRHYRLGLGRGAIRVPEDAIAEYLKGAEVFMQAAPSARKGFRHIRLP